MAFTLLKIAFVECPLCPCPLFAENSQIIAYAMLLPKISLADIKGIFGKCIN